MQIPHIPTPRTEVDPVDTIYRNAIALLVIAGTVILVILLGLGLSISNRINTARAQLNAVLEPAVVFAYESVSPENGTICNRPNQTLRYPFVMAIEHPPVVPAFVRTIWSVDDARTVQSDSVRPNTIYRKGDKGIDTIGSFTIEQSLAPGNYELRIAVIDGITQVMYVPFKVKVCPQ